ncbi:MAG: EAL domain-containing protein [Rhodocyclaceae bacterium]|nr:EAL domain-containing protein [Rhodocyclaceae bacterium]MBP7081304.1 EAL domain-containing protein [Rhodocyclaceae bacterium]
MIPKPLTSEQIPSSVIERKALRSRRLNQIAIFVACVLAVRIADLEASELVMPVTMLSWTVSLCVILLTLWLNHKGKTELASLTLLLLITTLMSLLTWTSEGLYDTALYAYPGILIAAGLLLGKRQFYGLLIFMLGFVSVIGWLSMTGIHPSTISRDYNDFYRTTDILLILAITGITMRLIVNDVQTALETAESATLLALQSQSSLEYLAHHDSLTGLPNRLLGRDRIEQALNQARRHNERLAVMFVDLDNFKTVNDTLGHDQGDMFLKQVANRLIDSVRQMDIISRQGGDEFLVGITNARDAEAISTAAAHILTRMAEPFPVNEVQISLSCSIGIAVYPDDGDNFETLVQLADLSMYKAKESGRNASRFYDPTMNSSIVNSLHLNSSLREALTGKQFILHYQPVIDISTQQLIGAEALIRWHHPSLGMIPPVEFIAAAEKSGQIVAIGEWVVQEGCRQMMAWQAAGLAPFVLSVNLSPVQFKRGNIEAVVAEALERSGLAPCFLELEITETALIDDADKFIASLNGLKSLGVSISIDDFGTGYSNLSYLQRFAIDKLKIDQSFIHRLNDGPQELAIVTAIIQMAKGLNLATTAEGIDSDQTRQQLLALGCNYGQGYYISQPCPAAEFEQFVEANLAAVAGP